VDNVPLLELIQELRGHTEKANNAILVELVITSELEPAIFLDLDMYNILHVPVVW